MRTISHLLNASHCPAVVLVLACVGMSGAPLRAQSPYGSSTDFEAHARMLRDNALLKIEPKVFVPTTSAARVPFSSKTPWKDNIITTVFWVGEQPTARNPTPNHASCWDSNWASNYGGFDDPDITHRRNFIPVSFTPRLNPFYCALPYNDVTKGTTKSEARIVIPWFVRAYVQEGHSVCKDHWVAIRHGNRVAYAQWEDCGPFRTDHYQYVFGAEVPRPNLNGGAGLDVSPAVRDYIGMNSGTDVCAWKFVDDNEVPAGPWRQIGSNNTIVNRVLGDRRAQNSGATPSGSLFGH